MPRKIRELIRELSRVGFVNEGGIGSERNFRHTVSGYRVTTSGKNGGNAKPYQEKAVLEAMEHLSDD